MAIPGASGPELFLERPAAAILVGVQIFEALDPVTADGVTAELEGERLVLHHVLLGETRTTVVLARRADAVRLARAILGELATEKGGE